MVDGLKTYGNEEINKKFEGKTPVFICTIATTDTSKIHGISGAGASEELNMYTPAADVEIMKYGAPHCMEEIPETVSEGEAAPTPSMLTKACLDLTGCDLEVVDAGCDMLQGYYFYRPMAITQLEKLFGEQQGDFYVIGDNSCV